MSTPSLVQHGIIAYFLWRWKKDMNESDRQLQASKCRLGQPFKGEHQKVWGNHAAHASVAGVLPGPRFWGTSRPR